MAFLVILHGEVAAAKLYHCRAYAGGDFYSSQPCSGQRAAAIASYDAPDSMPFEQQVKLIEAKSSRAASARAKEAEENVRAQQCASIERELEALSRKYTSWQYVPVNEVNADQARERKLKQQRSALQCR